MDDILRTIIYMAVILLLPVNLYTTYRLLSLSHSYGGEIGALSERATVAGILAIGSIAGAMLATARITETIIPQPLGILLNGIGALCLSIPAVYWLWKYNRHGFGEENDG